MRRVSCYLEGVEAVHAQRALVPPFARTRGAIYRVVVR